VMVVIILAGVWLLMPYFNWRETYGKPLEAHVVRTSFQCAPGELVPPAWKAPLVTLSVIVPAYNEEYRLPQMLDETLMYLEGRAAASSLGFSYEVVVVDDGSTDGTYTAALGSWRRMPCHMHGEMRVIQLTANRGKGFAVKAGVLAARGQLLLMADADGATCIRDVERLEQALWKQSGDFGTQIAFGSRHHLSLAQSFLMLAFRLIVWLVVGGPVQDTQCGFKLFHAAVGKQIFNSLHLHGWAFDIEILILARFLNKKITEVPVTWVEIPGSKFNPTARTATMLRDIVLALALYMFKVWRPSVMA